MKLTIIASLASYEGEIIRDDGTTVEIAYEIDGWEYYGTAPNAAIHEYGQRLAPWREISEKAITWTMKRDLDNLETWQ